MKNIFVLLLVLISTSTSLQTQLSRARNAHKSVDYTDNQLQYLAQLGNIKDLETTLNELLIPRVVGTPGHEKVHDFIVSYMKRLGWDVKTDQFQENTPIFGPLTFKNIVASLNPDADRFLVLACHYDSKYFKEFEFIGATDSAVPCAMMLNLATVMKRDLEKIKNKTDLSLQLIFFDGEEAFKEWNQQDSLYGAKHLSKSLSQRMGRTTLGESVSDLHRMDLLVLLDLIGAPPTHFDSYFPNTEKWYVRMVEAEQRLKQLGELPRSAETYGPIFTGYTSFNRIEDDHIPFLHKNVPVLHLISTPFPQVWHTAGDNKDVIDMDSVEHLNMIMRVFVAEYLHLSRSARGVIGDFRKEIDRTVLETVTNRGLYLLTFPACFNGGKLVIFYVINR